MKTLLLTLLLLLTITAAWAQSPQRISYQSIIRDANNVVVASSAVSVKISLLQGTSTGPAVYVETHGITTNANGLVSLNIGEGTAISGSFAGIDWSNGPYLIQTATDPTGGTDYSIVGTAPLNSVPYALNAANASVATTLAGTLPIASGGTGATTAAAARAALGLENVDNTSDANKPVSTATQTSLSTKVDKVTGKELSTNDYSTAEKAKLAAITGNNTGDQVNIVGNAATATKLQAIVTINGVAFDGSANITLPSAAAGIPYTGATQSVDLGAYNLKVNGLTIGRGGGNVDGNTANGSMSLYSNSSGNSNTAYGYASLYSNTTGSSNIANGNQSLYFNTTGSNNTAIGNASLNSNTAGEDNTAIGFGTLYKNNGGYNTASGSRSLYSNTTGGSNTAVGYFTGITNTTGNQNTLIGYSADVSSNNLSNATALGNQAIVTASNTIQLGNSSVTDVKTSGTLTAGAVTYPNSHGVANQVLTTTGSGTLTWATPSGGVPYTGAAQGVDLGAYDLKVNGLNMGKGGGSINNNTAFGNSSLGINSTGSVNTAAGFESLKRNTSGEANTAFGAYSLRENQNGARNTAVGSQALQLTNGAYDNTAIGALSSVSNTTGNNNVAIGSKSLQSNTVGRDNIAVGFEALYLNQANGNTASGYQSMRQNIGGGRNTALGYTALYSNTTASFNVAVGAQALGGTTTGERNVAIGAGALDENRTGSYNTVLGGFAGRYIANGSSSALDGGSDGASPNTIMDNSILIGAWTKPKANNETNQIVIGYNAIGNGSNTIQLGNTGITNVKTSGTLTAGTVTYPNVHNATAGQVLTTNASGVASWTTPAVELPTSNTAGDMLFWSGSAWVKVTAGSNGQTLTFYNGAPVWITNVNTVVNPITSKIWMDRNLGATRVATSSTDAASYGDLYQWGRAADGHQSRTSVTTTTLSSSDVPGNAKFILATSSPYDWRSGQNTNLWQGVSGTNNPCPTGYRIPTDIEWEAERLSWSANTSVGAFASPLKLPVAGYRGDSNGLLDAVGSLFLYWSSTVSGTNARYLLLSPFGTVSMNTYNRALGLSVRCLKD